jgi:iron complex transport system substrate-binding protein
MDKKILVALIALIAIVAVVAGYMSYGNSNSLTGTTITDMMGRSIAVPEPITKVLATSPPLTNLVYMVAPDKLGGWNSNLTAKEKKYMPSKYQNLPVVGGWFGTYQGNPETFIAQNPSIILDDASVMGNSTPSINDMQSKMGDIPVVAAESSTNASNFTGSIKFVGQLLGAEDQSNKLISFYQNISKTVNSTVSGIPEDQKVTVYYAEGAKGLKTDPSGSMHSQLIDLCGGVNVAKQPEVKLKQGNGMTDVSMEQVLKWNPEVIITNNEQFYNTVYSDSSWQDIQAVKNHRVYLTPTAPQGWFDRPPSVNTIIGIPWVAKTLYPDKFQNLNMTSLTKEFYSNFYHVTLTDDDVKIIMNNQTWTGNTTTQA